MQEKRSYGKHFVIVAVIIFITAVITIVGLSQVRWMAAPASAQARSVDSLLAIELVAIGFLFALVMVFMLYSLVAFRQRKGEEEDGDHFEGNTKLDPADHRAGAGGVGGTRPDRGNSSQARRDDRRSYRFQLGFHVWVS